MMQMTNIAGLDQALFHLANDVWTTPLLDRLMAPLSVSGNLGAVWLAVLAAIAAFGKKTGRKIALAGLVALVIGFVSSEVLKDVFMRPRPFAVLDHVRLLIGEPHSYAFPSGHATSSFAVASGVVLTGRRLLGKIPVWAWATVALAAAISYSRLYVGVHWPSDVAAGIALGIASGWVGVRLALRRWRRRTGSEENAEVTGELEYADEKAREVM